MVTEIGKGTFIECTNLSEITIPSSVINIGAACFYGCTNLTKVIFEGIVPPNFTSIENAPGVFDDNAINRKIYVPASAIDDYKQVLPEYVDDIEAIDDSESEI